jgi:hypothetical protein
LIIILSTAMKSSDASERADRISREIRLRESIPLLFGCYSAVIPLLVPLLFRCYFHCQRMQFIPQIHETANVFETIVVKNRSIGFFPPDNRGIRICSRPESVHGEPPRAGRRERACSKNTHMPAAAMRRRGG